MKILKSIIVFILLINVIVAPINLFMIYRYSKIFILSDNYDLKKVKIVDIESIEFSGSGHQNSQGWNIGYFLNDKSKYVDVEIGSDSYEHFINSGKKDKAFGGNMMLHINDSIWVWHHPKALDFYALGQNDTFKTGKYFLKTIFHLLLVVLAIWSVNYQIQYNNRKKSKLTWKMDFFIY